MRTFKKNSDLHMHSTASDGGYSPKELLHKCAEVGLEIISLTDHDTVEGIEEAIIVGENLGITVIPGIEFSTKFQGKSVHILGYGFDWKNQQLRQMLVEQRNIRRRRLDTMLDKLEKVELDVKAADVLKYVDGGSIGRPHVAKALIDHGYVNTVSEAFERYLAEGKSCYVAKEKEMTIKEAIDWIHQTGGFAIVAHPIYYDLDDFIGTWVRDWGLDGIEVYHRDHSDEDKVRYESLCKQIEEELGVTLLRTGGSDFHHEDYGRVPEPLGVTRLEDTFALQVMERLENH
ncbi:PHP domain-containing protein [Halalkalibacter urbisdiaboli]|uniref:PHP domain-containing protein n=1 Tax=Halalkalibacter urbisdiaboli TaxID=1960589 RepID=UPI000B43CE01|nr:PHP domain-containing protein [Halalkalibacter urbisdiaboli]